MTTFESDIVIKETFKSITSTTENSNTILQNLTFEDRNIPDAVVLTADTTEINGNVYTSSSAPGNTGSAYLAFNNDVTMNWVSQATYTSGNHDSSESTSITLPSSSTYFGEWIQIQYPKAIIIKSYSITPDDASITLAPEDFTLLYSFDGVGWSTADTQTAVTSWVAGTSKFFSLSNSVTGIYFRLAINKVESGTGGTTISELILNTDDRGQHWELGTGTMTFNNRPHITLTQNGEIAISNDGGGTNQNHYSYDGGITWTAATNGITSQGRQQSMINSDGSISLATTITSGPSLARSIDGCITWTDVSGNLGTLNNSSTQACIISRKSNIAYIAANNQLARSVDGGLNFELITTNYASGVVNGGLRCSDDGKYVSIYGSVPNYNISTDYGNTFTKIGGSISPPTIGSSSHEISSTGQYICYTSQGNLNLSKDFGSTFNEISGPITINGIAMSRDGSFFVATEGVTSSNRIAISYDYGSTWEVKILPQAGKWVGAGMSDNGHIIILSTTDSNTPEYIAYCHTDFGSELITGNSRYVSQKRDISKSLQITFSSAITNNDLPNLMFGTGVCRSFIAKCSIYIDDTIDLCELITIKGTNSSLTGDSWTLVSSSIGDESGVTFNITTGGQVQYSHAGSITLGIINYRVTESINI